MQEMTSRDPNVWNIGLIKAAVLLPVLADALPFFFMLIAPSWPSVPRLIVVTCSLAPPVVGAVFLVVIVIARYMKVLSSIPNGVLIGIVFSFLGIIEPMVYWI